MLPTSSVRSGVESPQVWLPAANPRGRHPEARSEEPRLLVRLQEVARAGRGSRNAGCSHVSGDIGLRWQERD
jgi:hypothetical protein